MTVFEGQELVLTRVSHLAGSGAAASGGVLGRDGQGPPICVVVREEVQDSREYGSTVVGVDVLGQPEC